MKMNLRCSQARNLVAPPVRVAQHGTRLKHVFPSYGQLYFSFRRFTTPASRAFCPRDWRHTIVTSSLQHSISGVI